MSAVGLRRLKLKWFSLDNGYFTAHKSTKCTDNAINIIQLNKDNKELFGNLIENQKQRRQRNKQKEVTVKCNTTVNSCFRSYKCTEFIHFKQQVG